MSFSNTFRKALPQISCLTYFAQKRDSSPLNVRVLGKGWVVTWLAGRGIGAVFLLIYQVQSFLVFAHAKPFWSGPE